jgi:D-proline reductase (dithiol) PrdB
MATLEELSLADRFFMKVYPYRISRWKAAVELKRDLNGLKLALISTAGLYLPEQPPFDERRGGDPTYREIPGEVNVADLRIAHKSSAFDQTGAQKDRNLVFPLDRLREMVEVQSIGALNHRHFSFMGSITAPGRLVRITAPEVADFLVADRIDAALLVPA